ncbi:MAG: ABC transporter substrate-binding protein [Sulfitobacter sp.]
MTRDSKQMDRRALFTSGAAAALFAATGVPALAAPKRGGRLRVAVSGAARSDHWDAHVPQGLFMQMAMQGAVFDTLTEVSADGILRGELATGWHGSADAQDWTFDLRPGVTFHNGVAFCAQDVVASLALHRDNALRNVVQVKAINPHRVQITLAEADTDFAYRLSGPEFVIYPADHMDAAMTQGIGTGLYRVQHFQPGQQFLGARVASHWKDGTAGWFDQIELASVPAMSVRVEALCCGYVDAAEVSDPAALHGVPEIIMLPSAKSVAQGVSDNIAVPNAVGAQRPFDNLRAAERWWMA